VLFFVVADSKIFAQRKIEWKRCVLVTLAKNFVKLKVLVMTNLRNGQLV